MEIKRKMVMNKMLRQFNLGGEWEIGRSKNMEKERNQKVEVGLSYIKEGKILKKKICNLQYKLFLKGKIIGKLSEILG